MQYLAQKQWVHVGVCYLVRTTNPVAAQKFHHGYTQEDELSLYVFIGKYDMQYAMQVSLSVSFSALCGITSVFIE